MSKKLLTYEEAKRAIEATFKPASLGIEEAVLLEAYNRVLAVDIVAPLDIPGFNSARVAGYASKSADTMNATEEEPVDLKVVGAVNVGETPKLALTRAKRLRSQQAQSSPKAQTPSSTTRTQNAKTIPCKSMRRHKRRTCANKAPT